MARGIQKSQGTLVKRYFVGPDVLGDTAGLILGRFCFSDKIKKCGLAMINMAHNRYNRIAQMLFNFFLVRIAPF